MGQASLIVMPYYYFIGIDVAKTSLALTVVKKGEVFVQQSVGNNNHDFKAWLTNFKRDGKIKAKNILCCLEGTGLYHELAVDTLMKAKIDVCIESPLRIKRSLGLQRGKNDKIDSKRIAEYTYHNKEKLLLWNQQRIVIKQLKQLNALKYRLRKAMRILEVSLEERKKFSTRKESKKLTELCSQSITTLKNAMLKTEDKIMAEIKGDDRLKKLFDILSSIPGLGNVIAIELIIATNEFKNFSSAKKFACYCGIAPFEHTSGSSVRGKARVSKIANRRFKAMLHMPALSATTSKTEIADYYKRKVAEGHPKMSVLNAVKYKLITRVFACVNANRMYEKK